MNQVDKYVKSLEWIRNRLITQDDLINPVMGVADWDDAVCVDVKNKIVASVDGPYGMRLVLKSALVHASTDVVVKGAKPLFALDTLVGVKSDVEKMLESLAIQASALDIALIGGNTLFEDVEPRASITVIGQLLLSEPIRDSTAQPGDVICLLGEPIWGEQDERIEKAKVLFDTWFTALAKQVKVSAAKDVTKGGLVSSVFEMSEKSNKKFQLKEEIPFSMSRNLDNFILTLQKEEFEKLKKIADEKNCEIKVIGEVI